MSIPVGNTDEQDALLSIGDRLASPPRKLTPKRPQSDKAGLADVFPYYAGFSFEWAKTQLSFEADVNNSVILDPWNGSGTTTLAARANGIRSIGVDLNPIANIVARLRAQVGSNIELCPTPIASRSRISESDPLLAWFSKRTANRVRQWSKALSLLPHTKATLGYVALFRVTRSLTTRFEGSNPTWVRRASSAEDAVDVTQHRLDNMIVQAQEDLIKRLAGESYSEASVSIIRSSSTHLPIAESSVDFILTSPPYLTRIDYAVAYSRELAILGFDIYQDRTLRSALMGTTLIRPSPGALNVTRYGSIAAELVSNISKHNSKASSGYYLKQARQYLDDLVTSFDEITRVSKPHAIMKLVVQDSYYKDIPIRLAEICVEEAERRGWEFVCWDQAEVTRLLTQVNTAARAYTKGKVAETVMTLKRSQR
ncbi:hypothetical protein [Streptosporangium sp. NPDC001681]|uniref:hypothetical protein n=1 Tax=Streptosporangium sp. NPDC001681 TaxID=3154395 RepID=UPI0033290A39